MPSWFAVQVRTRTETQVQTALSNKGVQTFLPTYTECRRYSDRVRKVQAAVFPGYLFCCFKPEELFPILTTPNVLRIVCFGRHPAPIDNREIESLRRVLLANGDMRPWPGLATGDTVRVEHGAFAGVEGKLVNIKAADHLILSITLLQRSASVEVDRSCVRPLDPSRARRLAVA